MLFRRITLMLLLWVLLLCTGCSGNSDITKTQMTSPKATPTSEDVSITGYGYDTSTKNLYAYQAKSQQLQVHKKYALTESQQPSKFIVDVNAFYTITDNNISAISLKNGKQLWTVPISDSPQDTPIIVKDTMYFVTRGEQAYLIYAFNTKDGSLRWRENLNLARGDSDIRSTLIDGSIMYIGTSYGAAAFDLTKRTVVWTYREYLAYSFSKLVVKSNIVYLLSANDSTYFFALNAQTGKKLWYNTSLDDYTSDRSRILVTEEATIYSYNSKTISALDPLTGTSLWSVQYKSLTDNNEIDKVVANNTGIYMITGPGMGDILALSPQGKKLWAIPSTDRYRTLVLGHAHVYALGQQNLYAFDQTTGANLWKFALQRSDVELHVTKEHLYSIYSAFNRWEVNSLNISTGGPIWSSENTPLLVETLL